jgi:hypothetical protein
VLNGQGKQVAIINGWQSWQKRWHPNLNLDMAMSIPANPMQNGWQIILPLAFANGLVQNLLWQWMKDLKLVKIQLYLIGISIGFLKVKKGGYLFILGVILLIGYRLIGKNQSTDLALQPTT